MKYLTYEEQVMHRENERFSEFKETAEEFSKYAADKGIEQGSIEYEYKDKIGMLACLPGIVDRLLPNTGKDKDGLYSMKTLLETMHKPNGARGSLQSEKFILLFSRFFRRCYRADMNWTPHFVDLFWNMCEDKLKDCYIKLDENRVKINLDMRRYIERDTWYGPKFTGDIEFIPNGNVKLVIPLDLSARMRRDLFGNIKSWDLSWATSGRLKTFQAIEFKESNVILEENFTRYHPVRYMHSEYNLSDKYFSHIDGAMMLLSPEEYKRRSISDFGMSKKAGSFKPEYRKQFKINGPTSVEQWIKLVSHFFHSNHLVCEYFSGSLPERFLKLIDDYRNETGIYHECELESQNGEKYKPEQGES